MAYNYKQVSASTDGQFHRIIHGHHIYSPGHGIDVYASDELLLLIS